MNSDWGSSSRPIRLCSMYWRVMSQPPIKACAAPQAPATSSQPQTIRPRRRLGLSISSTLARFHAQAAPVQAQLQRWLDRSALFRKVITLRSEDTRSVDGRAWNAGADLIDGLASDLTPHPLRRIQPERIAVELHHRVQVLDHETGAHRPASLKDIEMTGRVSEALPNIHALASTPLAYTTRN